MSKIKRVKGGFNFQKELAEARSRTAYYEEDVLLDVATQLLGAMEDNKVTKSELARRMDVSPPYITKILQGHTNMTIETMTKIASAIGLKWECLLIPQDADVGVFSLSYTDGGKQIQSTETATVCVDDQEGRVDIDDDYKPCEEFQYELSVPA